MRIRARLLGGAIAIVLIAPMIYLSQGRHGPIDSEERLWDAMLRSDAAFLVEYFDPRCTSCAAFAPVWEELTTAPWPVELHFATLSIEARAGLSSATLELLSEQGLPNVQLFLPKHGDDARGQRLRPPEQHRVMAGLESSGMTSAALKQRVLDVVHTAELEEMGLLQAGDEEMDASDTSLAGGEGGGGALGAGEYATDGDDLEDGDLG